MRNPSAGAARPLQYLALDPPCTRGARPAADSRKDGAGTRAG